MRALRSVSATFLLLLAMSPRLFASDDPTLDMLWDQLNQTREGPGLFESAAGYIAQRESLLHAPRIIGEKLKACGTCSERKKLQSDLRSAEFEKSIVEMVEGAFFSGRLAPTKQRGLDPWEAWKIGIKIRPDIYANAPPACSKIHDIMMDCATETPGGRYSYDEPGSRCAPYSKLAGLCAHGKTKEFAEYLKFVRATEEGKLVYEKVGSEVNPSFDYHNVPANTKFPVLNGPSEGLPLFSINVVGARRPGTLYKAFVGLDVTTAGVVDFFLGESDLFKSPWKEMLQKDFIEFRSAHADERTIGCYYSDTDVQYSDGYLFWYKRNPEYLKSAKLEERLPHHPLLRIGSAITQCPASAKEAAALAHVVPIQSIRDYYGDKIDVSKVPDKTYSADNLKQ